MPIIMTARWNCQPGAEKKTIQALQEFVAAVRANEPRTQLYTALQESKDTTSFMTYFIFEDDEARAYHSSTPWVERFTQVIYPESQAPVEFSEYRLVATTA